MNGQRLHQVIERISLLFRANQRQIAVHHGIQLVHLEVLVFLLTANRYSDTPSAITEYLGVTKGTVSQSLKALEARGLIVKVADDRDARLQHCRLTGHGREIAQSAFPEPALRGDSIDNQQTTILLEELLRKIQHENGYTTFGICKSCRHYGAGEPGMCGLTKEALSDEDSGKVCREHSR